jgi:undecaprenyl-diphosphatase
MVRMSASWPLGLGGRRWWLAASGLVALLGLALALDRPLSAWAQDWPAPVRAGLEQLTAFGESGWILYPAAGLFVVTAALALMVRWALMRTLLGQFAALYAFIFAGVGLPVLVTALAKRLIGRGRPGLFETEGLLSFQPNWAEWSQQSFPSGHATTAFALAAVIGFLSPRWFPAVLGLAVLIGVSRVALGAHYPSDVVAGAFVGVLGAYAARWAFAWRGWMVRRDGQGSIATRPLSALVRYLALKRRGNGRGRRRDQP